MARSFKRRKYGGRRSPYRVTSIRLNKRGYGRYKRWLGNFKDCPFRRMQFIGRFRVKAVRRGKFRRR